MSQNNQLEVMEHGNEQKSELVMFGQDSPLLKLAEQKLKELQELNPACRLSDINVFTRLRLNTKGQFFYELAGQEFKLSDSINVQVLAAETNYQFWDSEENTMLCWSHNKKVNFQGESCERCPYDPNRCKIRCLLVVKILAEGEEDDVFVINLPSTGAYAFFDYIRLLKKKYKCSVHEVVTTMHTVEKSSKEDSSRKYNAVLFNYADKL